MFLVGCSLLRVMTDDGLRRSDEDCGTCIDHSQNQSPAVASGNGKLHSSSPHEKNSPRSLSFREQNRCCGIGSGNRLLLQGIRHRWGKIAKSLVGRPSLRGVVYDMSSP